MPKWYVPLSASKVSHARPDPCFFPNQQQAQWAEAVQEEEAIIPQCENEVNKAEVGAEIFRKDVYFRDPQHLMFVASFR